MTIKDVHDGAQLASIGAEVDQAHTAYLHESSESHLVALFMIEIHSQEFSGVWNPLLCQEPSNSVGRFDVYTSKMPFVKVLKNKAYFKRFQVKWRRRRSRCR